MKRDKKDVQTTKEHEKVVNDCKTDLENFLRLNNLNVHSKNNPELKYCLSSYDHKSPKTFRINISNVVKRLDVLDN
jgi:hypothetical protein